MASIPMPRRHPLAVPHFRRLWIGSVISLLGDQFYLVALPWLVLNLTGSGLALGTIMMAAAIPRSILMLMGGALSDRTSPRQVMLMTAALRTVLVAAVGVLVWLHLIRIWHLYVLGFLFGMADAFAIPAMQTYVPVLVPAERLPAANATLQGAMRVSMMAGSAPAGWAVKAWGIAVAFFIDAASFLFIIGALIGLPDPPPRPAGSHPPFGRAIVEGMRYAITDPAIRYLLLLSTAVNFCTTGPFMVGLAIMAKTQYGSASVYGALVSVWSAGGLLGALAGGGIRRRRGLILLVLCAFIGCGLLLIGLVHHVVLVGAILFAIGFCGGLIGPPLVAWFQTHVPREYLGRAMSVLMFAVFGTMPFSLAATGAIAEAHLAVVFLAAGSLVLVITFVGFLSGEARHVD